MKVIGNYLIFYSATLLSVMPSPIVDCMALLFGIWTFIILATVMVMRLNLDIFKKVAAGHWVTVVFIFAIWAVLYETFSGIATEVRERWT